MSISASSFSAGYTGSKVVSNTSANTGAFRGFIVNDDAVVSAILDERWCFAFIRFRIEWGYLKKWYLYKRSRRKIHFLNYLNKRFNRSV
jgi:hypothetical protein